MSTIYIKQNDRRPVVAATLTDQNGVAVNLTGATSVLFTMRRLGAATPKIDSATCLVTNATAGTVQYSWAAGDTDTPGRYEAEFEIVWSAGITEIRPPNSTIEIVISPEL